MPSDDEKGWREHSIMVLTAIKQLNSDLRSMRDIDFPAVKDRLHDVEMKMTNSINDLALDVTNKITELDTSLKLKSGVWGMLGGLLGAMTLGLIYIITKN